MKKKSIIELKNENTIFLTTCNNQLVVDLRFKLYRKFGLILLIY